MRGAAALSVVRRSPALKVGFAYGFFGVCFAGAQILFARALSTGEYAILALIIALLNLCMRVSPAGADGVIIRRGIEPSPRLLLRVLVTSTVVGAVTVAVARVLYVLEISLLVLLLVGVVGTGATVVAAAQYQRRQKFGVSLSLSQSSTVILAVAAIVATAFGIQTAEVPLRLIIVGYIGIALYAWNKLLGEAPRGPDRGAPFVWGEALSYAGVSAAYGLLTQLERLTIPKVLTLDELATFAVLAAIVGSPYRMLQLGVGYTLFPRLRAATTISERRRLILREGLIVAAAGALVTLGVWYVTPVVVEWFLSGKYDLPPALVLAAIVAGVVKVFDGFANASVTALAGTRRLAAYGAVSWLAVALGVVGAVVGRFWGLTGVIYGVAAGWLIRTLVGAYLATPGFRERSPMTTPPDLPST